MCKGTGQEQECARGLGMAALGMRERNVHGDWAWLRSECGKECARGLAMAALGMCERNVHLQGNLSALTHHGSEAFERRVVVLQQAVNR